MNLYLLASAGGVSFLCLLAGLLPLEAMLAAEELVIDTQKLNPELGTSISISAKTGNPVGILQMQPNTWQTRGLTYNQSQVESTKAADSTQNSNQLEQPHSNLVFTTLPTSSSLDPHSSVPQLIVQQASNSNNTEGTDNSTPATMAQVTSVSQLSDVQLTDWAFQALQSLVERYGCIAGYPDGTYWGNRALTRYEGCDLHLM